MKCPKCQANNPDTQSFCGDCGTQLMPSEDAGPSFTKTLETPVEELAQESVFADRYRIIESLGRGGMGRVYKAFDTEVKEQVALKLIKPEIARDEATIERFRNELKVARKVSHRNVCRMHDLGKAEEGYYITMEYVEGKDLKSHIRRVGKLTEADIINIAQQVCDGLKEAHELGIIHRDMKPQNIMIDKNDRVKIMDFGIARSVGAPGVTATGVLIGTPDYLSPEQAEGEEVDHRSDIYSFGVILYEMVTGTVPFYGDTALSVALKHKSQLPPDPRKLNPEISEDLSRLILICMEKGRGRRYQTAHELLADLGNIAEGLPLGTKIRPQRETFFAALIRRKLFIPAVIGALAIIAAGIFVLIGRDGAIDSIAVLPFENMKKDPELEYLCDGITEDLIDRLYQFPSLKKVIARNSAFQYRGKRIDPKVVGEELDVDAVLLSWINQRGDELSIGVELVNTHDSGLIWTQHYEQEKTGLFNIKEQILKSVIANLNIKVTADEQAALSKEDSVAPGAYDAYFKALYYLRNWRTEEEFNKAIEYSQQAIQIDPDYVPPYELLAHAYVEIGRFGILPPSESFPRARDYALKAISIDETSALAHAELGAVKLLYDWDAPGGQESIERAFELNPNNPYVLFRFKHYLNITGKHSEKNNALIQRQIEIDPLYFTFQLNLAEYYLRIGQYDESISHAKRLMEKKDIIRPWLLAHVHAVLARCYIINKLSNVAVEQCDQALAALGSSPDIVLLSIIGNVYARAGRIDKAQQIVDQFKTLASQRYVDPFLFAIIYLGLGDKDQAFAWFEKANEVHSPNLVWLNTLFWGIGFDTIHSDPRYIELINKIGIK